MSKNIAISDEVYERLKREKGDRSFSEVIADHLEAGGNLADVSGANVLSPDAIDEARAEIEDFSEVTINRMTNTEDSE